MGRSRGGFSTKLHIRCDGHGLPLAFTLTSGEAHESKGVGPLLVGVRRCRWMLGDRGYDADAIREKFLFHGTLPVIPSKCSRRTPIPHDRERYRERNRIALLVGRLKQFRRIATRYDKTAGSFLSFVHLAASRLWIRFVHTR